MSSTDLAVQVYQLCIWRRQISPQIWRRLLVRSGSTIAELHDTLQIAFGWMDDHLYQLLIRGKSFGIGRIGGISFDNNPHQGRLDDLHFRWKETWVYEYDLPTGGNMRFVWFSSVIAPNAEYRVYFC